VIGAMAKLALVEREPTGAVNPEAARIKLEPLGTPMRAQARAHADGRLVLEAELPWLQLGASCSAELSDGRSIDGTVDWIGLDVTRSGTARLRILVNACEGPSIQLSVSDADVQELLPAQPNKRRFRWLLPIVTALVAAGGGFTAANLLAPRPQLLTPETIHDAPRAVMVMKIPSELAVAAPAVAPPKPIKHKIVRRRR
jgi:hypothetical protein